MEGLAMGRYRTCSQALCVCTVLLLVGCGGGSAGSSGGSASSNASAGGSSEASASVASASAGGGGGLDRCALLKDGEIDEAIGPHDRGSTGLENEWGLQSCRWTATRAQNVEGYPNGWHDAVEVAVFDAAMTSWARDQATGEPVTGFASGAKYDESYGNLWFDCAGGRFCVVKARTASGDHRQEIATKLARTVQGRLH
jgi:Protein of unknown function (DUF3558)